RYRYHAPGVAADDERLPHDDRRANVKRRVHELVTNHLAGFRVESPQIPAEIAEVDDSVDVDHSALDGAARRRLPSEYSACSVECVDVGGDRAAEIEHAAGKERNRRLVALGERARFESRIPNQRTVGGAK